MSNDCNTYLRLTPMHTAIEQPLSFEIKNKKEGAIRKAVTRYSPITKFISPPRTPNDCEQQQNQLNKKQEPSATSTEIANNTVQDTEQKHQQIESMNRKEYTLSERYFDYSKWTDEEVLTLVNFTKVKSKRCFPEMLHMILERSELDGYSSIIRWASHGRAFKILNRKLFLTKVMPHFFFGTRWPSFVRQLGTYGFHKIVSKENEDANCFWHNLCLRGRPRLSLGISRKRTRLLIDPTNEPDFSVIEDIPPSSAILSTKEGKNESKDAPRRIQYLFVTKH